jgi:hypothetical protein
VREHEPSLWERVRHVLLPKDYVRFRMSGEFAIDVADASGTLMLDVAKRRWSDEMLDLVGLDRGLLPRAYESPEVTGRVSAAGAEAPSATRAPHSGQKRLLFGSLVPQFAQLAMRADTRLGVRLRPRVERPERLRGAPAQRTDERAVVLVRHLAGAVVELELLQRRQRAVPLLDELEPPALERVRLVEPVVLGRRARSSQERPRGEQHARDGEQGAEKERDAHRGEC